ncbi:MAG: CPBP family intramembrane metalloprotease [Gemmataceae bacterium]|nr:CPBP family intramembrane metalloprotease [Gemmataceae bacterium]
MVLGWFMVKEKNPDPDHWQFPILILEIWDFLLVLGIWGIVGRVILKKPSKGVRWTVWLVSPLLLAAVLVLNIAYHMALREFVELPEEIKQNWTLLWIALAAVQPALVEELFFRYLALGAFSRIMGIHAAVWISSVLFSLAHIYSPLSMPYLFLAGLMLGYLRVGSGGLLLPMVAHFLHNLFVIWYEAGPQWMN